MHDWDVLDAKLFVNMSQDKGLVVALSGARRLESK